MTTITITKENFGKKMGIIYKELLNYDSVKIKIEKPKKKLLWTEYEEKSYNDAKKELENGDVVDLSSLLMKYNLKDLKNEYEKNL